MQVLGVSWRLVSIAWQRRICVQKGVNCIPIVMIHSNIYFEQFGWIFEKLKIYRLWLFVIRILKAEQMDTVLLIPLFCVKTIWSWLLILSKPVNHLGVQYIAPVEYRYSRTDPNQLPIPSFLPITGLHNKGTF